MVFSSKAVIDETAQGTLRNNLKSLFVYKKFALTFVNSV